MSDAIITISNLGKRYRIAHRAEHKSYVTLRDVIARKFAAPFRASQRKKQASVSQTEDFWALRGVSFEVKRGEVIGIIGRNGAGKSTVLKILSRITEPTEGRVCIKGRVASLLEVGTGFHPELTGRENIFLNGAILGMHRAEIKSKFDEIVAFAEVEKFLDTPVKRYSSGMYVRLAFAVAAHLEPEILIVDEVLAVGDAEFQKKCLGKMGEVAKGGRTVLFVSHNMGIVKQLCENSVLLKNGKLEMMGETSKVVAEYLNESTGPEQEVFNQANRINSSPECRITDAWITAQGKKTAQLEWDMPFAINLKLQVDQTVSFAPEFLIRNFEQVPVLFSPTGRQQGFRKRIEPGCYQITAVCPALNLASGLYYIDLMIVEPGIRFFDYCENGLHFELLDTARPPFGWRFKQERRQGNIPFAVQLEIEKLNSGAGQPN